MGKTLERTVFVALSLTLLLSVMSCAGNQKKAYLASIQPILKQSESLDADIVSCINDQNETLTVTSENVQIDDFQVRAKDLKRLLSSITPPVNLQKGHSALLSAASARNDILVQFRQYNSHIVLIDLSTVSYHSQQRSYYLNLANSTNSKTYLDLASREQDAMRQLVSENGKWMQYLLEDLDNCQKAVDDYSLSVRTASAEFGIPVATKMGDIDLKSTKDKASQVRQLNDTLLKALY